MRQCAKVYFQLKMEIQNGQKKVQPCLLCHGVVV